VDPFEQAARNASRDLRRLPAELRKRLGAQVREDVADPLAADIKAAMDGPYRAALVGGVKTRVQGDPMIVVGGSRKVLSGGASVPDVVYGDEFGGGSRVGSVRPSRRSKAYQRRTTRQFNPGGRGNIVGTIRDKAETTFDRWVDVVDRIINESVS
jgi:hypothetical protein